MEQISLKALLEAGCHFGHQVKRWHPKAHVFIYQARDGIHIIDLVASKTGLEKAAQFIFDTAKDGGIILFVGTKRQASNIVANEAKRVGAAYLTHRWIGGFLTNWDEVKKNLAKLNRMRIERDTGEWEKFRKHEQVRLGKELKKLEGFYAGVAHLTKLPDVLFIIDIRREESAVREATRRGVPVVGIVDTNSDPTLIEYPIPANDDAVGSITYITTYIARAYEEGKLVREKELAAAAKAAAKAQDAEKEAPSSAAKTEESTKSAVEKPQKKETEEKPKKKGRPKKTQKEK